MEVLLKCSNKVFSYKFIAPDLGLTNDDDVSLPDSGFHTPYFHRSVKSGY